MYYVMINNSYQYHSTWFDGYGQEQHLLIYDFYGNTQYGQLLRLLDGQLRGDDNDNDNNDNNNHDTTNIYNNDNNNNGTNHVHTINTINHTTTTTTTTTTNHNKVQ